MLRPYIILNCAISIDGKLATIERKQVRLSSENDMQRVHNLRNSVDAILVGINTVLADNPKLLVKQKYITGAIHNPIRIVLDSRGRTPDNALVLDGSAPTVIVTCENCKKTFKNVTVLRCGKSKVDINKLMPLLYKRNIRRLLVEGGSEVFWSFISTNNVDEICIYISSVIIGGRTAPSFVDGNGFKKIEDCPRFKITSVQKDENGILLKFKK